MLLNQIERIKILGFVLDIGFSYPYELIELYHLYNPKRCIGIDLKEIESSVSNSLIEYTITQKTGIDNWKISNLIRDGNGLPP